MRSATVFAAGLLLTAAAGSTASAQSDSTKAKPPAAASAPSIEGAWTGYLDMGGNGMAVNASFKKEKDSYTGTISGMDGEVPLQQIELKGDTLTAMASMPTPNGNIEVWYWFTVTKDALSGGLDANVQGQSYSLPLSLKRPE